MLLTWIAKAPKEPAGAGKLIVPPQTPLADTALTVFDLQDLRETFMAQDKMIDAMLVKFIAHTKDQLESSIPQALAAEDWETALREAHTIKGTALTMSGKELGAAAARLETAFRTVDRDEIAAALPPVQEAFTRFKTAAERHLRKETPL
jgi:HPt (histidine-containing phosphotransfer) domain-containing protein